MESFAELFESSGDSKKMRPGVILDGIVVNIVSSYVIVYAGLKSESNIPIAQFRDTEGNLTIEVGDSVEVAVDTVEDGFGATRLSRDRAKRERAWENLRQAYETGSTLRGLVNSKIKGGFTVDIDDIRVFLPGSLVDVRPIRESTQLEGKTFDFKVIKLDRHRSNVVVSRRAVVDEQNLAERDTLMQKLVEGAILPGVVKNLTDYGAFVDLGGIDGLLHITDMAWKRVRSPEEEVSIGDHIEVMVLKFDREKNRVSLGVKQMGQDPWIGISERFPKKSKVKGVVTNMADYGCFVKIDDCIEGLVHVSEMNWTSKSIHPSKVVQRGDEVEVMVLDIDEQRRRISLGLKQCLSNPWETFAAEYNKGDHISGKIKSITDFGLFVGLPGSIDGLVHLSDLSWNASPESAMRNYHKGDTIEAMVLLVDAERERISLGVKQLEKDVFSDFVAQHAKDSNVSGVVSEIKPRYISVDLGNVEGRIKITELSSQQSADDPQQGSPQVGDTMTAKIMRVDRKARIITLSIKALESEEEVRVLSRYSASELEHDNKIGDIIKHQKGRVDADVRMTATAPDASDLAAEPQPDAEAEAVAPAVQPDAEAEAVAPAVQPDAEAEAVAPAVQPDAEAEAVAPAVHPDAEAEAVAPAVHPDAEAEAVAPAVQPDAEAEAVAPAVQPDAEAEAVAPAAHPDAEAEAVAPAVHPDAEAEAVAPAVQPDAVAEAVAPAVQPDAEAEAVAPAAQPDAVAEAVAPAAQPDAVAETVAPAPDSDTKVQQ